MSVMTAEKPTPIRARGAAASRRRSLLDTPVGRAFLQAAMVVALLLIWELGVRIGWVSDFLFGTPSGILRVFLRMVQNGELVSDTAYTVFEAILGFVIGTLFGSIAGLALWYSIFVARLVEPFIVAFNSVPKIALAPLIILWFGTGLVSKVMDAVLLTAIVALIAAYQAAKDSDTDLQSLLVSMGASKHQIFCKAVAPSAIPSIIATFRINIGFGLVGAVVGEFISSQRGLGHLIYQASSFYDLNTVWVGLFMLMLVGFVLYYVIDVLERALVPWKVSSSAPQVQV
jgi:NitT/TauT family transport system permease protein